MGNFIEVSRVGEIPPGTMKAFKVAERELLVANCEGKYYAIDKKCTHAGGDLSKGKLNGKIVTCPRHGSKFDVTTGSVVGGPAKKNESSYEVKVEDQVIKVNV
jgi:nitrite reductase/ring-hydroxylating ferredoxin subunit